MTSQELIRNSARLYAQYLRREARQAERAGRHGAADALRKSAANITTALADTRDEEV